MCEIGKRGVESLADAVNQNQVDVILNSREKYKGK